MKNLSLIIGFFSLLLLSTGTPVMAQSLTDSTFYLELQDELDLFAPDSSLGDKIWGLVTISVSNMRSDPKHSSELVSQITMGTPVKLLGEQQGWLRVESPEGYNGWVDTIALKRLTTEEIDQWKNSKRYLFNRISGYAYYTPNGNGHIVTDLVLGDIFEVENAKWGFLKIRIPDGRIGYVRKKDCISWVDWINKNPDIPNLLSIASQMLGSPYLWGGTSVKATDCSGFVKVTYLSQAIVLERDASQQARTGDSVDFSDQNNLQPGDLLFFGTTPEKISHVGIYLGNGNYIHSSGYVHINNIDPDNPSYNFASKKHLVAVRRIISSLNSEGIARVKNHPWYNRYIP